MICYIYTKNLATYCYNKYGSKPTAINYNFDDVQFKENHRINSTDKCCRKIF